MADQNGQASIDEMATGDQTDGHVTADEMDEQRKQNMAYEYLCRLEEAKLWIEACIKEDLPDTIDLEENLQNGVILAKLGHFFSPKSVPLKRIFDIDQTRYQKSGLHFRHTDNSVQFFGACEAVGLPNIFYPDTSDVYDRKNMPKLIFCIHALSLYLHKLGKAPLIQSLLGKVEFTEEEISAMRAELEKYGIQMPAFGKIGGILANEMPVDEAALHAAVIAINEALDKDQHEETLTALNNPMAHMTDIIAANAESYHLSLCAGKTVKTENAKNQLEGESNDDSDVYDMLLTKDEIQANINSVNLEKTLKKVDEAVDSSDEKLLMESLQSQFLNLSSVQQNNKTAYLNKLTSVRNQEKESSGNILNKQQIQAALNEANKESDFSYIKTKSADHINSALNTSNKDELYSALSDPSAKYPPVKQSASSLYLDEFKNIKQEKGTNLVYEEVYGGLKVLTAVAVINESLDSDDSTLKSALEEPDAHIQAVEDDNLSLYFKEMKEARESRLQNECPYIVHEQIQEIIDNVNENVANKLAECEAAARVNKSLVADESSEQLYGALSESDLLKSSLMTECRDQYKQALKEAKDKKGDTETDWMRTSLTCTDGSLVDLYVNIHDNSYKCKLEDGDEANPSLLTHSEIKAVLESCNSVEVREQHFKNSEDKIVKLQSHIRGVQSRRKYAERLNYLKEQEKHVIKLQSHIRGVQSRRKYTERLNYLKEQEKHVIKLQACVRAMRQRKEYQERMQMFNDSEPQVVKIQAGARMMLQKKKYKDRLNFFSLNVDSIVKIQAAWRSNRTRADYKSLMHDENPPLKVVKRYMYLLDQSDKDYTEEIDLQNKRTAVVTQIRSNQQLEKDLQAMDLKIGLLVKNRITLEEVITHEGKLNKHKDMSSYSLSGGLTSLNKESQQRLAAYQHLFYHLQVNPQYLARLIFEMPQQASTKFIESVILTLYNYASNPREEYLILKLFATSLKTEIETMIPTPADVVTGNPLAVKMAVDFHRNARGHSYLREMLNPLITSLLSDPDVKINTNPIEVYKTWINQTESESGVKSELPYDVTNEEALKHEEVENRMDASIQQLRTWSDKFVDLILASLDQIPYGMRYVSKVMYNSLRAKFPDAPEKDILKVIGNLLYYRYINSTIAAPDAYGIIDIDMEKGALTPDQRRNLGSIAKILQFAASNKGFGGDSQHLSCLNSYIKTSHEKFKAYFRSACEVEEPDAHFDMDQYSDASSVTKPQICISLMELLNTHTKLLEFEKKIAPEESDVLHELLRDVGEKVPTLSEITGDQSGKDEEIKLTLASKYEGPLDEKSDLRALLSSTKTMTVAVTRCVSGGTITECLQLPVTQEQHDKHKELMSVQEEVDIRAEDKGATSKTSVKIKDERKLGLDVKRDKIKENLQKLSEEEMLSADNDYQSLVNMIATDIRNQSKYRVQRRKDLAKLTSTMENLQNKRKLFETQIDSYKDYVKNCLNNLALDKRATTSRSSKAASRNRSSVISVTDIEDDKEKKRKSKSNKKQTIKYTAAKLHERGVLIEIEDVATDQLKSFQFEISTTENSGEFSCTAKYHGLGAETHALKFQDLLQLQYEGVAEMVMFDRAKVNVNLLIFLLNKKFYVNSK